MDQRASTSEQIEALSKRVKEKYPSIIVNIIITALLALGEEFIVEANFRCPCVTGKECSSGNPNETYAIIPVVFSAFIIFVLGFFANSTVKCVYNGGCTHGLTNGDFWFWISQALMLSLTWFCFLAIDGDYIACIRTCNAYNLTGTTCEEVEMKADKRILPFSDEYDRNKETSQWVGYVVALIPIGLFMLTNLTKFECCGGGCILCKCCCKYKKELSAQNGREVDEDAEKAVMILKDVLSKEVQSRAERVLHAQHDARVRLATQNV